MSVKTQQSKKTCTWASFFFNGKFRGMRNPEWIILLGLSEGEFVKIKRKYGGTAHGTGNPRNTKLSYAGHARMERNNNHFAIRRVNPWFFLSKGNGENTSGKSAKITTVVGIDGCFCQLLI